MTRSSRESSGTSAPARATSSGAGRASASSRNPLLCSAASLLQWRRTLSGLLGRPPAHDEPIFVPLDGALLHLEALTRDGAAHAVNRASSAAGLVGNYASRSLSAGFVTDALDAGAIREQVQHHGRWTNVSSIDPYYRKTQVWGTDNPSSRLAAGE